MKKRNRFYRLIHALLLCAALISGLMSCASAPMPDYRATPFSAEIRYELYGTVITAELTVGNTVASGAAVRDIELKFTSPPDISGLLVYRKDGVTSITQGDTAVSPPSDAAAVGFLRAAELMIYRGELCELEKLEENGKVLRHAKIVGASGEAELWCDEAGIPKRITDGTVSVTVIRFKAA